MISLSLRDAARPEELSREKKGRSLEKKRWHFCLVKMSSVPCDFYPVNDDCIVPISEDRNGYLRRLKESSPALFVCGQERLEVVRLRPDSRGKCWF